MVDVLNLLLYCAQQVGITLGVGASTTMLIAYTIAMRDRVVDAKEAQFARAVRRALRAGLWFIIISGLGITALEALGGRLDIVFSPAFLFKWVLILVLFFEEWITERVDMPNGAWEGFSGGTWYALFILHILAPVATWGALLLLYGVWMAGFALCWGAIVFTFRGKDEGARGAVRKIFQPAPRPITQAPPVSAAIIEPRRVPAPPPRPVVVQVATPPPPPPPPRPAPAVAPVVVQKTETPKIPEVFSPDMPALRIMPQTPEDMPGVRPAVVQFN